MFSLSSCGFARGIYIRAVYIYRFCFFPPILFEDPPLLDFLSAFFLSASLVRAKTKRERARGSSRVALWKTREDSRLPRAECSLFPRKKKKFCARVPRSFVFFQHPSHIIFISLSSPARTHTQYTSTKNRARTKTRSNGFYLIIYIRADTQGAHQIVLREREREKDKRD